MNSVIAAIIAAVRIFMIWAFAWLPSDFRFANDILADILELHPLSKSSSKKCHDRTFTTPTLQRFPLFNFFATLQPLCLCQFGTKVQK